MLDLSLPLSREYLETLSITQLERLQKSYYDQAVDEGLLQWATLLTLDQPDRSNSGRYISRTYSHPDLEIRHENIRTSSGTIDHIQILYGPRQTKVLDTRREKFAPGPWVDTLCELYKQKKWEMEHREEAEVAKKERQRREDLVRGLSLD